MDAIEVIENLGLVTVDREKVRAVAEEVDSYAEHRSLRGDLLLVSAAEIEIVQHFASRRGIPPLPLEEPIEISESAAVVAADRAHCGGFGCWWTEVRQPWQIAVFSGDIAKLDLARQAVEIEEWERATTDDILRAITWIRDRWREQSLHSGSRRADMTCLQGVLWAAKIERVLRPDHVSESLPHVARELGVRTSAIA
jgi:hypothetical protein